MEGETKWRMGERKDYRRVDLSMVLTIISSDCMALGEGNLNVDKMHEMK